MSRHPIARDWEGLAIFLTPAFFVFGLFLASRSFVLAIGALLIALVGAGIYLTGESSNLPGTAGDDDHDVPT